MSKQKQQKKKPSAYKAKNSKKFPKIRPLTKKQDILIQAMKEYQVVATTGSPGTGKTFLPISRACQLYTQEEIEKIVLTRPNVSRSKSLGFRPGDLIEKAWEWFAEVMSVMSMWFDNGGIQTGLKNGNIELVPFETMKGRSFNDGFVFLDEAQNTQPDEMLMFLTRIGEDAQVVMNGDMNQSDIGQNSGLKKALDVFEFGQMEVPVIEFTHDDIVRGDFCKQLIINWEAYNKEVERR